eukprot:29263_1
MLVQSKPRVFAIALIFFAILYIIFIIHETFFGDINIIRTKETTVNVNNPALLHEIESLKLQNIQLKEQNTEIQHANNALQLQREQLLHQNDNNKANYYLLYGFCSVGNGMYKYHHIIMDSFKSYISLSYPKWIMLNISIESFLIDVNYNYTHSKLLNFTEINVPSINIYKDKFQWIFEPCCEKYFNLKDFNLKEYYDKNKHQLQTITLPIPQTIKEYLNQTQNINIIDDNEREAHNHQVTINHHKYINYSIDISDDIILSNIWQNNIYINSNIKYLQSLCNGRPFLMTMSGESFDAWKIKKHVPHHGISTDLHIQRTRSWPRPKCIVVSYIQGILQRDLTFDRDWGPHTDYVWNLMNYNKLILNKSEDINNIISHKNRFCSFTVKYLMLYGYYFADAFIRHTFNWMISEQYKHCDMLGLYHDDETSINQLCNNKNPKYKSFPAWHHLLVECQQNYKFSINMENTMTYGYSSEKIYTGLLAMTIPIYFGNKDIGNIVNLDRIIYCELPDQIVVDMRKEWWQQKHIIIKELGLDTRTNPGQNKTVQIMMEPMIKKWAMEGYGPYLQKCVDEMIAVDNNFTLYKWKLSQNIVPHNSFKRSHYDGTITVESIINVMKYLESPLFH